MDTHTHTQSLTQSLTHTLPSLNFPPSLSNSHSFYCVLSPSLPVLLPTIYKILLSACLLFPLFSFTILPHLPQVFLLRSSEVLISFCCWLEIIICHSSSLSPSVAIAPATSFCLCTSFTSSTTVASFPFEGSADNAACVASACSL